MVPVCLIYGSSTVCTCTCTYGLYARFASLYCVYQLHHSYAHTVYVQCMDTYIYTCTYTSSHKRVLVAMVTTLTLPLLALQAFGSRRLHCLHDMAVKHRLWHQLKHQRLIWQDRDWVQPHNVYENKYMYDTRMCMQIAYRRPLFKGSLNIANCKVFAISQ